MSFLGELGSLGTGSDAIHLRRACNLRLYGARARSLTAVVFADRRVLNAIRASVSETPANPGMGTRCKHRRVLLSPDNLRFRNVFVATQATAEYTRARTFGKTSRTTAPRSLNNDTLVPVAASSMDAPSPPSVSPPCHLPPRVDFPAWRVSIHAPRLQQPPSPHPHLTTLFPQHLQRVPGHSPSAPASYNPSSKWSKGAQNTHAVYTKLVASATPTTSRPQSPPRSRSRPRPAPGHHDLATQALATRRRLRNRRRRRGSCITCGGLEEAITKGPNARRNGAGRALFHHASAALDGSPQGIDTAP
ncbi:hypothetical protein K438DRAFT_1987603 [Mycena galopus ATCC 62051]|nr:hypothetical protein K438DRAFT_1987603 [Mycena galopus ATCC 62051]